MTNPVQKPLYKHHCGNCVHLGPLEHPGVGKPCDLYVCGAHGDVQGQVVVARYGKLPSDTHYISASWPRTVPELDEARRRAVERGLIPE